VDWRQCAAITQLCLPLHNCGALPPVHELLNRSSLLLRHPKKGSFNDGYRDEDHTTTTLTPPLQLGITVTASVCITAAHCRQSTKFSNAPRTSQPCLFTDDISTVIFIY